MKTMITIDGFEKLQIFACNQALKGATQGIFMAHPKQIRSTAEHWLSKAGIKPAPRAKWDSLQKIFFQTFQEIIEA
jgi:hypothetical protein